MFSRLRQKNAYSVVQICKPPTNITSLNQRSLRDQFSFLSWPDIIRPRDKKVFTTNLKSSITTMLQVLSAKCCQHTCNCDFSNLLPFDSITIALTRPMTGVIIPSNRGSNSWPCSWYFSTCGSQTQSEYVTCRSWSGSQLTSYRLPHYTFFNRGKLRGPNSITCFPSKILETSLTVRYQGHLTNLNHVADTLKLPYIRKFNQNPNMPNAHSPRLAQTVTVIAFLQDEHELICYRLHAIFSCTQKPSL